MNKVGKIVLVAALAAAVGGVVILKQRPAKDNQANSNENSQPGQKQIVENTSKNDPSQRKESEGKELPRLVDLGAGKCIPCKMMAPILEELKTEYAGRMDVEFIDVWENPEAGKKYGIKLIPTQIFYDSTGTERFRHEGFMGKEDILGKWKELGEDLTRPIEVVFRRLAPAQQDTRSRENICYMCDGDIEPKVSVIVKTDKGDVRLCSPHCYFIMYSCLTEDKADFEKKVFVTEREAGNPFPAADATYLYGLDDKNGRPWIKAFAQRSAAEKEIQINGGSIIGYNVLKQKEISHRCGFCDRAAYPEDAALVRVAGVYTWGCCSHCAMGVAARTGKDIEVHERDRLTGEPIVVKTLNGSVASIEPPTAVAWFGQRQKSDGKWGSAGCFHQGFFTNAANLKQWVNKHPYETGRQISIHQALEAKIKMSPQQIQKACKIGECAPK